jgi:hypothetical protein
VVVSRGWAHRKWKLKDTPIPCLDGVLLESSSFSLLEAHRKFTLVHLLQPAFAVFEGAPNEKPVIEEMDERTITARFEKRNVLDAHDPTFFEVPP